ncbi:MAG: valine--tRNA ligase [Paludibacteraceae bacterium]|nr:valine--tRNA ligase [Paludibacteraceae bacterium]
MADNKKDNVSEAKKENTNYNPQEVESRWYQYWTDKGLFHSEPDGREPFTVVIPPPNVTGVLHMGHVLNETIQDVLVRRARLEGKNACWVPGTDHASIATEAKVIKRLKEQGINKQDLTREEFLKHAWDWTDEHGGIILKQLRKLGCSCDWDRTAFTMDETRSRAVIKVFVDLYKKGLIYKGLRMVNWDPERQTALSDEEVIYHEEHSKFYYLKYRVAESDGMSLPVGEGVYKDEKGYYCVVATTRPETIFGDIAVCINPKEEKNQWLRGKHVVVPGVGREIPIIEDRYVEIGFGTGCLKVTPAHDVNDYALGQTHNLRAIDIFTADAHLNMDTVEEELQANVRKYHGMDRFECRKQIVEDLQAMGLVEKIEDYDNKVGYSERTNVPIEPRLSLQWFLKMQHFADIALPPVMNDEIVFYPAKYKNTYKNWLENIKDWCISRQLWWGHRIPAWYDKALLDEVGAEKYPQEKIVVCEGNPNEGLSEERYVQDEGALDTWFSSWLWPISLFDGIEHPDNKELAYYYPTADLVTGPDIIFFWVARMIMAGYEYTGKMPFKHVYFTGIVRDKLGRKMSKSLGNSPDPLDLIERYGADGVRMGILLSAPAGNDILYDDSLCEQGRNFCNKIWNCFRMLKGLQTADIEAPRTDRETVTWFTLCLCKAEQEVDDLMKKYRLSEALMAVYKLFTDEFSGWYLEMIKPAYGSPIAKKTYDCSMLFFERMLRLLHPFMPFITEELYHALSEREDGDTIMREDRMEWDSTALLAQDTDGGFWQEIEHVKQVVAGVRNIRAQHNISPREEITLISPKPLSELVNKLTHSKVEVGGKRPAMVATFIVGTSEYAVPLNEFIDVEAERKKLEADLAHQEGFLRGVEAKLGNEKFMAHAKPEVVEMERKKQHDALERITAIKARLEALNG